MRSNKSDQPRTAQSARETKVDPKTQDRVTASLKSEIKEIVGKRIVGVVVKENRFLTPPRQVFLVFEDETNFEFYADSTVTWTSGIQPGGIDWVRKYCATTYRVRFETSLATDIDSRSESG